MEGPRFVPAGGPLKFSNPPEDRPVGIAGCWRTAEDESATVDRGEGSVNPPPIFGVPVGRTDGDGLVLPLGDRGLGVETEVPGITLAAVGVIPPPGFRGRIVADLIGEAGIGLTDPGRGLAGGIGTIRGGCNWELPGNVLTFGGDGSTCWEARGTVCKRGEVATGVRIPGNWLTGMGGIGLLLGDMGCDA